MSDNVREVVFDSLMLIFEENFKSHLVIRDVLSKYDYWENVDKSLYKRLTEGSVDKALTLDFCIEKFTNKPVLKLKPEIRQILRLGAYQILFMDKIPLWALVDECVKLVKKRSRKEFAGFVNAVLRKIADNKDSLLDFSEIEDLSKRLSLTYSLPEWIVKLFIKENDDPEDLIRALVKERETCVRIKPEEKEKILGLFDNEKIEYRESSLLENVYLIRNFKGAKKLPGFEEGFLYFQDESSMMAVKKAFEYLDKSSPLILDVCAAPGGKSIFMSELLKGKGLIKAFDVSENKADLIRENIERLGIENISVFVKDARKEDKELINSADMVILDLPCSGLGVLSRKKDIKYKLSNEALRDISNLQREIIQNVKNYVKEGGYLSYSTCTIHKAENEKMVKFILKEGDFECEYIHQFLPNVEGSDGFFLAILKKGVKLKREL